MQKNDLLVLILLVLIRTRVEQPESTEVASALAQMLCSEEKSTLLDTTKRSDNCTRRKYQHKGVLCPRKEAIATCSLSARAQ
jgi:hypothetical protein